MSIHPRNVVLFLLLVVLVAANLVLAPPDRNAASVVPLFPALDPAEAARIEVTVPTDDGVETLELTRRDGVWVLPAHRSFPVLPRVVDGLLARVHNLATIDRVGAEASSHSLYGVDEGSRRLRIEDAAGKVLAEFLQGDAPSGAAGSHVRPLPGNAVYRTTDLGPLSAVAGRWIDTQLLHLDPTTVRGISVRSEGTGIDFALLRLEDGRWRVADPNPAVTPEYLAPAAVEPLLLTLQNLPFRGVADGTATDAAFGLAPPQLRLELDVGEAEPRTLLLGAPTPDGEHRYASEAGWSTAWVVTLPAASAARLEDDLRRVDRARQ